MSLPELDTSLFLFINKGLSNSLFDILMPFITGNVEMVFLPLVFWFFLRDRQKAFITLLIAVFAVALADGSGHLMKDLFERQRPCNVLENINLLVGCGSSFSMPSNHAVNSFAFAAVFWLMRRRIEGYFFLLTAAVIGFSRVYVGVHYPFDVLAGAFVGVCASYASLMLYRWALGIYRKSSYEQALFLAVFLISLFRIYYILTGPLDLSPDEAHYWEWSRRLDWSYYSKGPLIAYLIYAGTALFGNNVFGVRILAVVLSALGSLVLFRLGRDMYDDRTGLASALMIQIVPLYAVYGVIMTIDAPFTFFWILSLYLFYKAADTGLHGFQKKRIALYWTALGISIGLGMMAKYTMAFFYLCGFLYLLLFKDARKILASIWPYISFIISIVVFSPVILWNAQNGWVTFKHVAGQAHVYAGIHISVKSFIEFIGSQFGVVTPVLFVLILVAVLKSARDRKGAFLFWFSVPVFLFFVVKSIQGKVQANWALSGYITGLIAFAGIYIRDFELSKRLSRVVVIFAVLTAFILTALAHYPAVLNLPPKMDPTSRLAGWKEIGRAADSAYNEMASEGPVFIFSDRYQVASELAFYMKGNPVTYCVNIGRRMNQYDFWPGMAGQKSQNALFVMKESHNLPEQIMPAFSECRRKVLNLTTRNSRPVQFTIFKCYDFRGIKQNIFEEF